MEKLKLEHVSIVFANLVDDGFGRSLTIDATDKEVHEKITKWVKDNNIGKGDKAGIPNFKEYEGRKQYAIKISDFTQFAGLNGLTKDNLGFGAKVSLVANAFEYDNKFGKGCSANLSAVLVEERAKTGADADMAELMSELPQAQPDDTPEVSPDDPIDLDSIPF
jgi:hypothetical protein